MHGTTEALGATVFLLASATGASGQTLLASELASVSQVVDGTRVTVEYSRPRARGRTGLFGGEVKFGHVWTPGANRSTTLAVSNDVSINGHPVPKGKYSVWMVVAPGDWELVLDHDTTLYHTAGPPRRAGQIRFTIPRERRPFTEVLTWAFPAVQPSGMTLTMQWDTVYVPLEIKVTPSFATTVPADAGSRVTGTYHWRWAPYMGMSNLDATFIVSYADSQLRATIDPPGFGDSSYREFVLIPKKRDLYLLGRLDHGTLIEVTDDMALQFTLTNGHANGFEVRGMDDALAATGKITP